MSSSSSPSSSSSSSQRSSLHYLSPTHDDVPHEGLSQKFRFGRRIAINVSRDPALHRNAWPRGVIDRLYHNNSFATVPSSHKAPSYASLGIVVRFDDPFFPEELISWAVLQKSTSYRWFIELGALNVPDQDPLPLSSSSSFSSYSESSSSSSSSVPSFLVNKRCACLCGGLWSTGVVSRVLSRSFSVRLDGRGFLHNVSIPPDFRLFKFLAPVSDFEAACPPPKHALIAVGDIAVVGDGRLGVTLFYDKQLMAVVVAAVTRRPDADTTTTAVEPLSPGSSDLAPLSPFNSTFVAGSVLTGIAGIVDLPIGFVTEDDWQYALFVISNKRPVNLKLAAFRNHLMAVSAMPRGVRISRTHTHTHTHTHTRNSLLSLSSASRRSLSLSPPPPPLSPPLVIRSSILLHPSQRRLRQLSSSLKKNPQGRAPPARPRRVLSSSYPQ